MGLFSKKKTDDCCCTDEVEVNYENGYESDYESDFESESECGGGCGCGCSCGSKATLFDTREINSIKILGGGCAKCNQLEENVKAGMKELDIVCEVEHVKDFAEIAAMGVMSLPAWTINNKVVSTGKVLKKEETIKILKEYI